MDCDHGWSNEIDCDVCRPSAAEVRRLRERIAELEEALELAVAAADGCRILLDRPVTESDVASAVAEARRLRPQIEAEMAIRDRLKKQAD